MKRTHRQRGQADPSGLLLPILLALLALLGGACPPVQ